ncbi:MAG: cysteine hydrolase [Caulobacterales bacterium]
MNDAPERTLPSDQMQCWYNDTDYAPEARWRTFDPKRAALVLVDLINWQADPQGASLMAVRESGAEEKVDYITRRCADLLIPKLKQVMSAARKAGVQVIHSRLVSRHPDYADIVPGFRPYMRAAGAMEGSWGAQVLPQLGEEPGDISVIKTGSGAFGGSELDFVLRRMNIRTILYAGVLTNACVMLSATAGFDLGYRQYLISDCTAALSDEDQADTERLLNNYIAEVVTADDVLSVLRMRESI